MKSKLILVLALLLSGCATSQSSSQVKASCEKGATSGFSSAAGTGAVSGNPMGAAFALLLVGIMQVHAHTDMLCGG